MDDKQSEMIRTRSRISHSYATVKITQSRIDKGLIAIPRSLSTWFPDQNTTIGVLLNDSVTPETKNYSSYTSRTRESRIGGMADWFAKNKIRDGDEVVVQPVHREQRIYRLILEDKFLEETEALQRSLDASQNESEASYNVTNLAKWTNLGKSKVALDEYHRLARMTPTEQRRLVDRLPTQAREGAPHSLRVLLATIYQGHCQVCDFWFLKRDSQPYFEIHHIDPSRDNNPKNLILLCANCHRQFEYANVDQEFEEAGWLVAVSFNKKTYTVNQIILQAKPEDFLKTLFI